MLKSNRSILGILFLFLMFCAALFWTTMAESTSVYASISKNIKIVGEVFKQVNHRYVDEVDSDKFLRAAIDGMLNTLDPYTTYIEKDDKVQLQIITEGKYEGVGITLQYRDNVVTVGEPPFVGTPSARAGIREGDKIITVDGISTSKMSFSETASKVRGPAGTEVTLSIKREGEPALLEFSLIREQIQIDDIRYIGTVGDSIGYILLTHFSQNASPEIREALERLTAQGIKGLILDLRYNPGGILDASVDVSDFFLPKGLSIVSRKGRSDDSIEDYESSEKPIFEGPLAVLVNRFSASASEIVAGAIQDHDRGIILGDTTFGKGLVQSVVPLSENTALKITTAKYYTPSGRCIQKHNFSSWNDSTEQEKNITFYTKNGRSVFAGGGIAPDVYVRPEIVNDLVVDLRRKSHFFNFAVQYSNTHDILDSTFQITDKMITAFQQYLNDKEYQYQHPIEKDLSSLKQEAFQKGYGSQIIERVDQLQKSLEQIQTEIMQTSQGDIRFVLQQELASKYFGVNREVEIGLASDELIQKAKHILLDNIMYDEILTHKD